MFELTHLEILAYLAICDRSYKSRERKLLEVLATVNDGPEDTADQLALFCKSSLALFCWKPSGEPEVNIQTRGFYFLVLKSSDTVIRRLASK